MEKFRIYFLLGHTNDNNGITMAKNGGLEDGKPIKLGKITLPFTA